MITCCEQISRAHAGWANVRKRLSASLWLSTTSVVSVLSLSACRFCHKWFYGENELWKHMAEKHESCFVCKRSNPDRHVYYKDYAELEGQNS